MAISMENSPLHDLPPGTHLYFSEEYDQPYRDGIMPYSQGGLVTSAVTRYNLSFEEVEALTIPERLVMDYYEANWELGAMHCSGEDYDEQGYGP